MSGTQRLAPRRSSAICGGYAVRRETPACLLLYSSQRGQGGGGRGAGGARAWVPPGARATSSASGLASSTSTTCVAGRPRCASTCCSAARSWRTCSGVRANTGITTASRPPRSAPRGSLRALPHARTPRRTARERGWSQPGGAPHRCRRPWAPYKYVSSAPSTQGGGDAGHGHALITGPGSRAKIGRAAARSAHTAHRRVRTG